MRMQYLISLLLVFTIAVCTYCGKPSPKSIVLASVNGKSITQYEFDGYLKFKRLSAENEKRRQGLLDQYVEREALASVIEREKLLDDALIQAELNEFRKEMFISRYFEKFMKEKVADQAVQNYYNTHATNYEERKVHIAHILIRTNKKMSEPERKAKLTTIQEAYSYIRSGQDFAQIAQGYSEDKISAKKGGDLGWMKEGSINPRFSEIAFTIKPGEISEPFETPFGFHIIKVIEGPAVVKRPFEAVAGDIRYQLRSEAKRAELERLISKTKVVKKYKSSR